MKKQETGFTQVKNTVLYDTELSLTCKGLFAYLYSKPDDWDWSHKRIAIDMKESENTIAKYLKILEEHGYLTRTKLHTGKVEYYIAFEPDTNKRDEDKKSLIPKSLMRKSLMRDIGTITNKEDTNTKDNNKEIDIISEQSSQPIKGINEIINVFYETVNPTIAYNNRTTRSACEYFIKKFGLEESLRMAQMTCSIQGEEYAPVVTTPHEMKVKFAKLKIFFNNKERDSKKNKVLEL